MAGAPQSSRNTRFVVGGLALAAVLVGLKVNADRTTHPSAASTTVAAPATVTPTTLLPMNTTSPFHDTPDAAEWKSWLAAHDSAFQQARRDLAARLNGTQGATAENTTSIATWSAALLADPMPADPIGEELTASMSAYRTAAAAFQNGPRSSDTTAVHAAPTVAAAAASTVDAATNPAAEAALIKGGTLLQTALANLQKLGVVSGS